MSRKFPLGSCETAQRRKSTLPAQPIVIKTVNHVWRDEIEPPLGTLRHGVSKTRMFAVSRINVLEANSSCALRALIIGPDELTTLKSRVSRSTNVASQRI